MSLKNKHIVVYLISLLFAILLVVPCVFKQDVKHRLGIPVTQTTNKDKTASNLSSCTAVQQLDTNRTHVPPQIEDEGGFRFQSRFDLMALHDTISRRSQILTFQNTYLNSSTPLFIHLGVLII